MIEHLFVKVGAAWVGKKFAEPITDEVIKALKKKWEKFSWGKAEDNYRNKLYALYGTIRVLGKNEPVLLEGIFSDVFILDKPSAFRRYDIQQLSEEPSKLYNATRKNGLEVVKHIENNRLFILGKPGAGKTTFLKYIALQAVQSQLHKIPIFVSLKEWSDSDLELLPFLVKQFEICNFPHAQSFIEHILESGEAIVLFDGLDEVKQENDQRAKLITILNNFSKQYLSSQCLITCRIAATDYSFEQFTYMEVADFTDEQMQTFAEKWFQDEPTKLKLFQEEFAKDEHKGLRELGRVPLLLSLLCLAFEESLHFPARRVEVYEEALEALLKKWDTSRNIKRDDIYRKLSLGRKRQLFARIAAETFEKGDYFLHQKALTKEIVTYLKQLPPVDQDEDIDGDVVLKAIEAQHGIFVERAHRIYSFLHLTFQEYFTAKYIVDNVDKGTIKALIHNHLDDARWREVFLLTASLLDDADTFFEVFKTAIDDLVANDETLVNFLNWANNKAKVINAPFKPSAIRIIYCSLDLDLVRNLSLVRSLARYHSCGRNLDITLDLCLIIARDLSLARGLAGDLVRRRNLDLARNFDRNLALYLTRLHTIDNALEPVFNIDFHLTFILQFTVLISLLTNVSKIRNKISKYFSQVVNLSKDAGFFDLHYALTNLTFPNKSNYDYQSVCRSFERNLRNIMQIHQNIGYEWDFTNEQLKCLERYFKANQLLLECLNLAVVSDREAIENRLLLLSKPSSL